MSAARWLAVPLLIAICACGGDDKKKKEAKEAKPKSPMERVERLCQAECARELRCEEEAIDTCLSSCRLSKSPRMHVFSAKFVFAYADCLDALGCKKDLRLCREVAIATVMEDPIERAKKDAKKAQDDESPDEEKKGDEKEGAKKKKAKKKPKPDPAAERKLARDAAAAEEARDLYARCHDRRIGCDATYGERCDLSVALNDGGRERVRKCLARPCGQIRRCLQDAVSW